MIRRSFMILFIGLGIGLVIFGSPAATASPPRQFDDQLEQGEYIANIALCVTCHTPFLEEYNAELNPDFGEDQLRTEALFGENVLDKSRLLSGGREFVVPGLGVVRSRNLTPDPTGLGDWTDEEIETAMRTGINKEGIRLFPIMPTFTAMADSDVDAVIAYLRTLEPIENDVNNELVLPVPPGVASEEEIIAPDASDQAARGEYLVRIMDCSACHTPTDPETGAPLLDLYLAGGNPFEERYGVVYAGNITPHPETGLGDWTEDQLKVAIIQGVRIDGRRLGLMPWQPYSRLLPEDLDAMIYYLQNEVPAVDNAPPLTALEPAFQEFVETDADEDSDDDAEETSPLLLGVVGAILIVVIGGGVLMVRRRSTTKGSTTKGT